MHALSSPLDGDVTLAQQTHKEQNDEISTAFRTEFRSRSARRSEFGSGLRSHDGPPVVARKRCLDRQAPDPTARLAQTNKPASLYITKASTTASGRFSEHTHAVTTTPSSHSG